jgi:FkbM family methyltransferase
MNKVTLNENSLAIWQQERLEYIRYDYDLSPESVVIDLGAYQGEWAKEIFARYKCKIIAVEPTEYIRDFTDGVIINKAASTNDGKISFGGRAYYSSIFEEGDHEYECMDVNRIISGAKEIDLLKVNIEGAEYDVLNHIIAAGLHPRIKNIQVQFHQIAGVPYEKWYNEISKQLSLTHQLTWHYPYCWENWQRKA